MNTLIKLTLIWFTASIGYYYIIPIFGFSNYYNVDPLVVSLYYIFFSTLTILYFRKDYFHKFHNIQFDVFLAIIATTIILTFIYSFTTLAQLKTLVKTEFLSSYIEILLANKWYFFPKAFEVLFQDILIAILILELYAKYKSVRQVSVVYFTFFTGIHILQLIFTNTKNEYSLLLIFGAMLSAFVFPRLIIKQEGGIIYMFAIHFLFYVFLAMWLHIYPPIGYFIIL